MSGHLTVVQLAQALRLSVRMVRRYLAQSEVAPREWAGNVALYHPDAVTVLSGAIAAARSARVARIREAVAERVAIVAAARTRRRMPRGSRLVTMAELNREAKR